MSAELVDAAEETIIDFISCPRCRQYIQPPSVCCEQGHFMCLPCRNSVEECPTCGATDFPNKVNSVFDRILREIYYPCLNQESGCSGFFKYDEISEHQQNCPYERVACRFKVTGCREICKLHEKAEHEAICPFGVSCKISLRAAGKVKEKCEWRGRKDQLYDHICTHHSTGWLPVSTLQTNVTFAWMLPLNMHFVKTEFIRLEDVDEMFYFHVKCVVEGPQYLAIQHIGDIEDASRYMYTVEFKHGTKHIAFKDRVLPSTEEDIFNHQSCCSFHYLFLRHHFQAERVCDCYIRIYKKGCEDTKGKKLLQLLGEIVTEEAEGCISNRESFQDKIEYRLESMDSPDDPNDEEYIC